MKLDELLNSRRLWKSLAAAFNKNRDTDWDEFDIAERVCDELGEKSDLDADLRRVFEQQVIKLLSRPAAITADELTAIAIQQLAGLPLEAAENGDEALQREVLVGKTRFLAFVKASFPEVGVESSQFVDPFDLGHWLRDEEEAESCPLNVNEFWKSNSPPTFLHLCIDARPYYGGYHATAVVEGNCTNDAMEAIASELRPVLESIARTVRLSGTKGDGYDDHDEFQLFGPAPRLSYLVNGDGGRILRACLSSYFWVPGRDEDTILDRLHNATLLLLHADQVGTDPVALSLTFAAIEALICEKDELPVNKQIKRHASTLLVQHHADIGADKREVVADELSQKRNATEKVLAKLYNIRCDVMHGSKVDAPPGANNDVRRIAAGVIRAITCWRDNLERSGVDATWKELMDELNAASRKPSEMVGIPDLSELIPDRLTK